MRIACVHIPQFALQCVTRLDPSLRRAPVVVVGAGIDPIAGTVARVALHSPVVQACSRAAWALGIRIGMTATAARALSPDLTILAGDAAIEKETIRALADVLSGIATTDLGGRMGAGGAHLAMYCEVPAKTRGTSFGDRLIELLDDLGFIARVGIADDRFTAWVAAAHQARHETKHDEDHEVRVISVPRGGSAAFLAPHPLSLLAISPEVQHMLEALGVRTLGEFAALPAPSVARPHAAPHADYQALARGESGTVLRPYVPDAVIREEVITSEALGGTTGLAILAGRIALRLAGRDRVAARVEVSLFPPPRADDRPVATAATGSRSVSLRFPTPTSDPASLVDAIGTAIGDVARGTRLRVIVLEEAFTDGAAAAISEPAVPMLVPVRGQVGLALDDRGPPAEGSAPIARPTRADREGVTDLLGVVLASTGSQLDWQLTSPAHAMRHRRLKRGKHRVRRTTVPTQSRLFKIDG